MIRVACVLAWTLPACQLVLPIREAPDGGADAEADVAVDAADEGRVQDDTTVFCGPDLSCSRSNPQIACCVLFSDSGLPPANYRYECVNNATCAADEGLDGGNAPMITCDDGTDCPNPTDVCCLPSAPQPRVTYCFAPSATNCAYELCNPDAATPCNDVKHIGYVCVPTGSVVPYEAPLGYHVCVPPDGG